MSDDIINNKKQTKQTKSKRKTQNKTKQNKTKSQKEYQTVGTPKSNIKIAGIKCEKMPRFTYNRVLFLNLIHT